MITRRETLRFVSGALIACALPFSLKAQSFSRVHRGVAVDFVLEDGWWIGRFPGHEREYGLMAQDSSALAMRHIWPSCKRTIDAHLDHVGYLP